ncbi:nuclear pore complex protein Nup98-Nup96-like isoform X2 [Lineus longissimus]|uniref:nuclear pore complex protein Nup98-Nup96-like isoform X2 n=1 Tax=Lineus longissimus TaxID=88925 RepID=UPI002B4CB763
MFGQQNKTLFGGTSFGGSTSTFGAATPFGQSASTFGTPAASAFGTPAASTSIFGGTTTGAAGTGSIFGGGTSTFGQQPASSSTGFSFGSTATQPSLFGQTTTASQSTGLFGTPASSAFGAKTPGFGTTGTASTFGAQPASTGLFGASTSTGGTSLFGTQTTSAATTGTSLFGGFSGATAQAGTVVKFNPTNGTDTMLKNGVSHNISTRHQCITAMKEYEAKSLEELRVEDYLANRKTAQPGATQTSGLFGATTSQPSTGFSAFGQTAAAKTTPFGTSSFGGTTGTSLFGATQPAASGGMFTQTKPAFGTATTSAPSFSFGGTASTGSSLFGQSTQQKSLFGTATTQAGSLFGAAAAATSTGSTGFGFGAATPQTSGIFGAKPTGFGAATTTAATGFQFGQQAAGTSMFGKPAASSSGFSFGGTGSTFGQATTGTSLFGAKPTGLGTTTGFGTTGFGAGLGTTGLGTGSSLLGQQAKPSFGFGTTGSTLGGTTGFTGFGGAGTGLGAGTTATLGQTAAGAGAGQHQLQQQLVNLVQSPYGDSPLFRNLKHDINKEEILKPTNPAAQKAALSAATQFKISSRPVAKIKPKSLQSVNGKAQLFDGLDDEESTYGADTFIPRKSIKKLVIKNHSPNRDMTLPLATNGLDDFPTGPPEGVNDFFKPTSDRVGSFDNGSDDGPPDTVIRGQKNMQSVHEPSPARNQLDDTIELLNTRNKALRMMNSLQTSSADVTDASIIDADDDDEDESRSSTPPPHPAGIVLRRPGYYTIPSMDELAVTTDQNGDCIVEDFTVGREGYGSVFYAGITNVAGLNLDEIIHFRRKEVTVYPEDDRKPSVGEGLNKKAEVTLDCVWPTDKTTHSPIKDLTRLQTMNYQSKIEHSTHKLGAKFIDYRPDTGSWVFEVKHFSKYGLIDDSDDEGDNAQIEKDPKKLKQILDETQKQLAVQRQQIQVQEEQKRLQDQQQQATLNGVLKNGQQQVPMQQDDEDDDMDMADITRERMPEVEDSEEDKEVETVPSSHRLAHSFGVSAQSMQVMKASFFGDEDIDEEIAFKPQHEVQKDIRGPRPVSPIFKHLQIDRSSLFGPKTTSHIQSPRPASPKPMSSTKVKVPSMTSGLFSHLRSSSPPRIIATPTPSDHALLPSGMPQVEKIQTIVATNIRQKVIPLKKSLLHNKQHMIMDAASFMSRSFRVGWGPNWTLVHAGQPIGAVEKATPSFPSILPSSKPQDVSRVGETPYKVTLEKINFTPYADNKDLVLRANYVKSLSIHLKHSRLDVDGELPVFAPEEGVEALHEYAKQLEEEKENIGSHPDAACVHHTSLVWDLCVALWGDLPLYTFDDDTDRDSYDYRMARRKAVSQWLSKAASETIEQEVKDANFKGDSHLSAIFSCLSGGQIPEACEIAVKAGDHRLALMISQTTGNHVFRSMLKKQLTNWHETKADQFMDLERLKIYALLASCMVWDTSALTVNVCEDMDWKRALAIHLWYHCVPTSTISDAVHEYDCAFKGKRQTSYCGPPHPPYLEKFKDNVNSVESRADRRTVIRDCCYHILKLYGQRSHRLERILAPTTSTPSHLDHRLSWHLANVLQSLRYVHLSEQHHAMLNSEFIAQLEAEGLWEWAVFVALHDENNERREHAVHTLLSRHITLRQDSRQNTIENFLVEELHVPKHWLHEAKALRAHYEKRHHDEAWHLLKAGHWNKSHVIVIRHIATDCIINEDFTELKRYLVELAAPEHAAIIKDWNVAGGIFYDFIRITEKLDALKKGEPRLHELERLHPEVISLCNRIGSLECRSARDRLCQSEMSKRTANLLQVLLMLQDTNGYQARQNHVPARLLAPHVGRLPMPEDYSLQELRNLTRSYLIEMTM